ncbi:MAG: hypothetical protein WC860_04495 [Candidatus Margulisiibacteriota bacterium]|jgi:hypothetical protein
MAQHQGAALANILIALPELINPILEIKNSDGITVIHDLIVLFQLTY